MEQFVLWGSFVNVFAIIGGSIIGLLFKHFMMGNKKSPRMEALSDHILKGIALCVLGIGIMGTIKGSVNDQIVNALAGSYAGSADHPIQLVADLAGDRTLIIILSMMFGSLIGQLLDIDRGVNFLGAKIGELVRSRFGNVEQ